MRDRWLLGFLPACRSGNDEPNVGHGAVAGKDHQRIFQAMKRSNGGEGVLELPRTKVGWPK